MSQHLNPKANELTVSEELRQLVRSAEQGDPSAVPKLRSLLHENPDFWRYYANLGEHALEAWLTLVAGENHALREALRLKLADLHWEVVGPSPSPLERLVADRVVLGWLQAEYASLYFAQLKGRAPSQAQMKTAADFEDRSQRRYLAAIRQLAQVRKMLRPALSPLEVASRLIPETGTPVEKRNHRFFSTVAVAN